MGKKSHRLSELFVADVPIVLRWLKNEATSAVLASPRTVLGTTLEEELGQLNLLIQGFERILRRGRKSETVKHLVSAPAASTFVHVAARFLPSSPMSVKLAVQRAASALKAASANRRKGRPYVGEGGIGIRLATDYLMIGDRQRKRLKARTKIIATENRWILETIARGETVLTSTVPRPDI